MSFKDTWIPRVDGVDYADSSAVNEIADALIELEEEFENNTGGGSVDLSNYLSKDNDEEYTPESDYNPATKKYVDDAIAEIDVGGDKGASTPTVSVGVGNTKTTTYDLTGVMAVTIPVDAEDTEITLKSSVGLMTVFVYYDGGFNQLNPGVNETTIDLTQYTGVYELYVVPTGSSIAEGTLITEIPCPEGSIYANVREGSIGLEHLSDKVLNHYPTKDSAGVVKVDRAKQGLIVTDTGELRVYCAEQNEIKAKSSGSGHKPVSVQNFDFAMVFGTHQSMSDEYKVSDVKIHPYVKDIHQGQLPASYDATKGYIDSSISNLIAKLKAAGVNID